MSSVLVVGSTVTRKRLMPTLSAGAVEYVDCISANDYVTPSLYPEYNTKQSDDEAPVLALWGMERTPTLLLIPGPH